jgi:tRNA pseudouridine55 synthase
MDGLLVVDKPAGLSSHDVVARMRRILRERRIGHTGTLDPDATGVLPLVIGRATRLARFLTAAEKSYDAVVRLGRRTDTADASGAPIGPAYDGPMPSRAEVDAALASFRGTFLQQPPAFSAKKIAGVRSYEIARKARAPGAGEKTLAAASVAARRIEIISIRGDLVDLQIDCSAGFYVRSLADDLGERLGTGGHLLSLRRTRAGDLTLDEALALERAEREPDEAIRRIVPLARLLPGVAAVVLTADGVRRAIHGRELGPGDAAPPFPRVEADGETRIFRLLDHTGALVAIAEPSSSRGLLHPAVVLV